MMNPGEETGENAVQIRRGRVDSLSLYEITDNELEILATGSPSSLHLNLGISLLSMAVSFFIALLTTNITSERTFTVFVVIFVSTLIVGSIMMLVWWRAHKSTREIIKRIRDRLPSEELAPAAGKGGARRRGASKGKQQKTTSIAGTDETEADVGKEHGRGGEEGSQEKEKGSVRSEVESGQSQDGC
jgi:hypothetical protein